MECWSHDLATVKQQASIEVNSDGMTQVIDRRNQPGPSFLPSSATSSPTKVKSTISSTSSKVGNHTASLSTLSDGNGGSSGKNKAAGNNRPWSVMDDAALHRSQSLLLESSKKPLQFVKSSSTVVAEVPFRPINEGRQRSISQSEKPGSVGEERHQIKSYTEEPNSFQSKAHVEGSPQAGGSSMSMSSALSEPSSSPRKGEQMLKDKKPELYPYKILFVAPTGLVRERGAGLHNKGNTCYMNSVLQSLVHLPPLLNALLTQDDEKLRGRFGASVQQFDAMSEIANLAKRILGKQSTSGGYAVSPTAFLTNLKSYARTLRPYRQEDAHEFLRFLLDAMQKSSLMRAPKSLKPADPIRETTLVHKIFGGRLRSRVQCQVCKYNSDTFDPILDLSLDIRNLPSNTLGAALSKFTELDHLRGSEKYKCEKCRKPVNATKQFTIDLPPRCLTIHLKRFTLTGQKLSKQIQFPENLTLSREVLSEGVRPAHYTLRSVVHHQGSGPNSGHYIASVRHTAGASNKWFEANDDTVTSLRGAPTGSSSAYLLFYVRRPDDPLSEAASPSSHAAAAKTNGVNGNSKGSRAGDALVPKMKLPPSPSPLSKDLGRHVERQTPDGQYRPAFKTISPASPVVNGNGASMSHSIFRNISGLVSSPSSAGLSPVAKAKKRPAPSDFESGSDAADQIDADDLGESLAGDGSRAPSLKAGAYEPLTKSQKGLEPSPASPSMVKSKKQRRKERQRQEEKAKATSPAGRFSPYHAGGLGHQQTSLKRKKIELMKSRN